MPAPALTHHDILGLVEPFARRGRHVDLAASDRAARRLTFKPVHHPGASPDAAGLHETLQLESFGTASFQLTRTLTRADGVQATLRAAGPELAPLLARIEAVAPEHQFREGPGFVIARSYGFDSAVAMGGPEAAPLVLSRGVVQVAGLVLSFNVLAVRGVAADLSLAAARPADRFTLPEDLLAVIGWDWARLVARPGGWTSKFRLRGRGAQRTAAAEQALEIAATHLARVLAEAPGRFHDRFRWARWGVVLRRAIPSLTAIGLILAVLLLPHLSIDQDPGFWLALHYLPIGVLALSFCLQELPRFEIPPWPRPSRATRWCEPAEAAEPLAGRAGGAARPQP